MWTDDARRHWCDSRVSIDHILSVFGKNFTSFYEASSVLVNQIVPDRGYETAFTEEMTGMCVRRSIERICVYSTSRFTWIKAASSLSCRRVQWCKTELAYKKHLCWVYCIISKQIGRDYESCERSLCTILPKQKETQIKDAICAKNIKSKIKRNSILWYLFRNCSYCLAIYSRFYQCFLRY